MVFRQTDFPPAFGSGDQKDPVVPVKMKGEWNNLFLLCLMSQV